MYKKKTEPKIIVSEMVLTRARNQFTIPADIARLFGIAINTPMLVEATQDKKIILTPQSTEVGITPAKISIEDYLKKYPKPNPGLADSLEEAHRRIRKKITKKEFKEKYDW